MGRVTTDGWSENWTDEYAPGINFFLKKRQKPIVEVSMIDLIFLVSFLTAQGIPSEDAQTMTCIAKYESNFNSKAINIKHNKNKTIDVGLFQINSKNFTMCKTNLNKLLDVRENIACAITVYKKQGLKAWSTYKKYCQEV